MLKFQRNYRLEVQDKLGATHLINFPLTCDFDISRNTMAGFNQGEFTIFNLSDKLRQLLVRNSISFSDRRTIKFYAGYGKDLPLVFSGFVQICVSTRDSVDWMTSFSCQDTDPVLNNNNISISLEAGSSQSSNVETIVNTFMNPVKFGKIGNLFGGSPTLPRGNSHSGPVGNVLRSITNKNFFIDNGIAFVLAPWECLEDQGFTKINSSTGLLGSPEYQQSFVNCKILFEPRIVMAQEIEQECGQEYLNGRFKVVAIDHSGRISGSAGGEAITTVSLYNPLNSLGLDVLK